YISAEHCTFKFKCPWSLLGKRNNTDSQYGHADECRRSLESPHTSSLGQSRAKTRVWSHSVAVEAAAMGGHTAPYDKMEPSSSVRRPESGREMAGVWRWRQQPMGGRYRDHDTHFWTWQQHEEAVQGPMTDYGAWQQHVRRPESGTWQSLAMKVSSNGRPYRDP
ncbi:unnamed protein product, partial [Staurois parvus]